MPGPGKKPTVLKMISGTVKKYRLPETPVDIEPLEDLPEAPHWLPNAHAVLEFIKLAAVLHANRLLTCGGVAALGHLCALHGKMVQLWSAGETPTGHMVAQYRALVNDFGLTPVAQGKVHSGDKKPAGNKFASNGKKAANQ